MFLKEHTLVHRLNLILCLRAALINSWAILCIVSPIGFLFFWDFCTICGISFFNSGFKRATSCSAGLSIPAFFAACVTIPRNCLRLFAINSCWASACFLFICDLLPPFLLLLLLLALEFDDDLFEPLALLVEELLAFLPWR